jgi:hypothetical protein
VEKARALVQHFELPLNLWQFAIEVAVHTRKLVPSVEVDISPYEKFF